MDVGTGMDGLRLSWHNKKGCEAFAEVQCKLGV